MENWRPLSVRGSEDPRFDTLAEGVPVWIREPVLEWVEESFTGWTEEGEPYPHGPEVRTLQMALRLDPALRGDNGNAWRADLVDRIRHNEQLALDVVDWLLHHFYSAPDGGTEWTSELDEILATGGSAWEVVVAPSGTEARLGRRMVGPVAQLLEGLGALKPRVHGHLALAWEKLAGRQPDASGAYREAVRAVEAAAKPVVLPNDAQATLGKMIRALADAPTKWETTIGSVDDVRQLMASVWKGQLDRHGTDDVEVPLHVSEAEASAAFSTALAVSQLFVAGHVRRARSHDSLTLRPVPRAPAPG